MGQKTVFTRSARTPPKANRFRVAGHVHVSLQTFTKIYDRQRKRIWNECEIWPQRL